MQKNNHTHQRPINCNASRFIIHTGIQITGLLKQHLPLYINYQTSRGFLLQNISESTSDQTV